MRVPSPSGVTECGLTYLIPNVKLLVGFCGGSVWQHPSWRREAKAAQGKQNLEEVLVIFSSLQSSLHTDVLPINRDVGHRHASSAWARPCPAGLGRL